MPNQPGENLGQYRLVEQIGRGGMATVFKAYQPSLDRYVAIKILSAQYASDPDFIERFRREARAVARLRHPNILTVFDYGEEHSTTYIVMEFIDGCTLKHLLGKPLEIKKACDIIAQVASALDYAHRQGIVHRDVKPSNVLVTEDGRAVLSDFGIAKMMEATAQLTAAGVGIGTPEYMSPEQGMGKPLDHRSDIYSLGVMLYEMLTGRTPFSADTPYAVIYNHINKPLPLPRDLNPVLSEAVQRVILKALAKEPVDRYQSAGELSQALNSAAQQEGATIVAPPLPEADPLATMYSHARAAQSEGRQEEALSLLTQIQRNSPGYRDVPQLLQSLQAGPPPAQGPRVESRPVEDIDALYREAMGLLNRQQWGPALELFRKVSAINPNYQNVRANIAVAEGELGLGPRQGTAAGKEAKKGGFPKWAYGVIGGGGALVLVCGLGVGLIAAGVTPLFQATATPTVTVEPTAEETAEPTPEVTEVPADQPTEVPTEVPAQSTPAPSAAILEDDFADNKNGWYLQGDSIFLEAGQLHLKALEAGKSQETWAKSSPALTDFVYEATVTKIEGPEDYGYGVIFQRKEDFEYAFTVSGDGSYHLSAWLTNKWEDIVPWTESPAVKKGNETNSLKVVAQKGNLALYINDELVKELKDDFGYSGQVGLFVGKEGLYVVTSHVKVTAPPVSADQKA